MTKERFIGTDFPPATSFRVSELLIDPSTRKIDRELAAVANAQLRLLHKLAQAVAEELRAEMASKERRNPA